MSWGGWIGVDLDGTLADFDHKRPIETLGPPILPMLVRVKGWLMEHRDVRIFTARVANSGQINADGIADNAAFVAQQRELIQAWCVEHLGQALPITATKDFLMVVLYDDRCVAVETNTGRLLGGAAL